MFVSMIEIMLAGLVTGAACIYTSHKQKMLTMMFMLLFLCLFYFGFLVSSNQLIFGQGIPWVFPILRVIIAFALIIAAFMAYIPYHGFFHTKSNYTWLAVSSLFFFIGWHAGHWFSSLYSFTALFIVYVIFFIGGNTIQGLIHFKWRQKSIIPFTPFIILLLFSFLMLL
ncbi:hypothetical protein J2S78_002119 [Salibacterium salarium]|uniref:hypothetical protein n=1 Tax=Salibacterium salarium TaxID=284579 RepID=UPI00278317A0|nr:hypothetical protein [Salibacterium salarium]MDQ0299699.1 hypothetical protein [Salibacterium salarium]